MKTKKINIILLVCTLILVLYFSLKDDLNGVINIIFKIKIEYLIISIILFLFSLLFKSLSLKSYLNKYYKDYSLKNSYMLTLIGQFLNGITPFQSGGQPFQIYLLKKDGKRITDSTSAMLKDNLSHQIALVLIGLVCLIINFGFKIYNNSSLFFLVILGFVINFAVLLILTFIILAKRRGINFINKILNFLCKFKLLKKLNEKKDKLKDSINRFYALLSDIKNDKMLLFKTVIYNIINLLLLYSVTYIIFLSLGINSVSLPNTILTTTFVTLIGNFIPIPGATGGIEFGFYKFYGYFITGSLLTSAMLLWRFVTYILGMIIGFITLIVWKGRKK